MHFTRGEDVYYTDMKVSVCCRDEDEEESSFVWPEQGMAPGNEEQILSADTANTELGARNKRDVGTKTLLAVMSFSF